MQQGPSSTPSPSHEEVAGEGPLPLLSQHTTPDIAPRLAPLFHVVLHEPEIPNNTGNIGRTCVATRCALHLIYPLGFDTSEKACRRAGLDYWPRLGVNEHQSFDAFSAHFQQVPAQTTMQEPVPAAARANSRARRMWMLTTHATRSVFDADFQPGDALVFGKESAGLPRDLVAQHADTAIVLPMAHNERSLNLATAVCAVVYEGIRQLIAQSVIKLDARGRIM